MGANRPSARRSGRVLLGMYAVRLLVLGAPRRAGRLPGGRTPPGWPSARSRSPVSWPARPPRSAGLSSRRPCCASRAGSPARPASRWPSSSVRAAPGWPARTTPPGSPFRPGAIDVAGLAVMALALGVTCQAAGLPAMPGMTPNGPGSRLVPQARADLWPRPGRGPGLRSRGRGAELVSRGVLPGRTLLQELDGTCSVPAPSLDFSPPGPSVDGTFYSAARRRTVGYTIAYPPGHRRGTSCRWWSCCTATGGNHAHALAGMSPAQAVALRSGGRPGLRDRPRWRWSRRTAATATGTRTPATTRWRWWSVS